MKHSRRPLTVAAAVLGIVTMLGGAGAGTATAGSARPDRPGRPAQAARPPACVAPDPQKPPEKPTPATDSTVAQAYYCIFSNYYSGPVLDSRTLLVPAFSEITRELQRRGIDQPDAALPALTGRKDTDWAVFSKVYQRIARSLPGDEARAAIADAAVQAMVDALGDNHARWFNELLEETADFGWTVSAAYGPGELDPLAKAPTYINGIAPGSPAEQAGLRLGDEVLAVDGVPLYVNGTLNEGVLSTLLVYRAGATAKLTVHRPATGRTFTVTVTSRTYEPPRPAVTSKLVDGNLAEVSLPGFSPDLVDDVLEAIQKLRDQTVLRGVILDLRGNLGGSPEARSKLLGALAHNEIVSYWCDVREKCTPNRTDDSVELLHLPVVVLVDHRCASACDAFASAVKDLELGQLVGTRTAGVVSGAANHFLLNNNTLLMLPKYHEIGANREIVNTIGVPPDHYAPTTAEDLSAGRDPALAKAISLL
ncbi:S41 family peptidase [Flindersiella endophytica]